MGEVFLCTNVELGNKWAMKRIRNCKYNNEIISNEENTLKLLNHANIPLIIDIFKDNNFTYIVETYVRGISLNKLLMKYEEFSELQVIDWCLQLCDALDYLHNIKPEAVIYRDMKPSNIMITEDNKVFLIDFGAAIIHKEKIRSDSFVMGTSAYSAPEQLIIDGVSDARTDVYGIGATLFEMLTGIVPYSSMLVDLQAEKNIKPELKSILIKCLSKEKYDRYCTVEVLKSSFKAAKSKIIAEQVNEERQKKLIEVLVIITSIII